MNRSDEIRWAKVEQLKAEGECRAWARERDQLLALLEKPDPEWSTFALNNLKRQASWATLEAQRARARIGSAKARQRELSG